MKKAFLARSPLGFFAFDPAGKLLFYEIFTDVGRFLARQIDRDFLKKLPDYEIKEDPKAYTFLRKHIREYARNFANLNDAQFNELLTKFSIELSTRRLVGATGRDKLIVQAVRSLDDLTKTINVFSERLYEWYSLHYPEMKNVNVTDLVAKHGKRENFPSFKSSTGVPLNEADELALRKYAYTIQNLSRDKRDLENYIKNSMHEVAKNLCALTDPLLAARIMAYAGSLEKLARMPASTIQLLGAEKALFRHLHTRGKSPKYGLLFNSILIQRAKNEHKGKVARILSSKLMMAVRIDFYSGRDDTEKLKKELKEEIEAIK